MTHDTQGLGKKRHTTTDKMTGRERDRYIEREKNSDRIRFRERDGDTMQEIERRIEGERVKKGTGMI